MQYRARITRTVAKQAMSNETTWHNTYQEARAWIAERGVLVTENITSTHWSGELRDDAGLLVIGTWSISKLH